MDGKIFDDLIPLGDLPKHLPQVNGRRVNVSTCWRWCLKGIGGTKLEAVRIGRCWFTTPAAVQEFGRLLADQTITRLEDRATPAPARTPTRSEARRAKDVHAAKARLIALGAMSPEGDR